MMNRRLETRGFSLIETLLAVVLFATLLMAVFSLLQSYAERELARATSKYVITVATAMDQILHNVDNFAALYNATLTTGGGYQLIADFNQPAIDNITKDFQVGGTVIQASRLFENYFTNNSPLRSPVRILLRIADNPAITTDTPALEVLIVTTTPRPEAVVRKAASMAGASGGFITSYGNKAGAVMRGSFGSWSVAPSNGLQATPWYASEMAASLNANTQGAYLVNYSYANLEDVTGDYLYRLQDTDPALRRNTMYGSLNIGGNEIIGADDVNIGNAASGVAIATGDAECQGNVMCVNGSAILSGSGSISGDMTTQGSAFVADSMNVGALRIENGMDAATREAYGAQNMLVVDATGNGGFGQSDEIRITGNVAFANGANAGTGTLGNIHGQTTAMPEGAVLNAQTAATRRISAINVNANSLTVDRQLKTGIVSNGPVSVNGTVGAIDIKNTAKLTLAPGGTLTAPKVNLQELSVSNFGNCSSGCGN